MVGGGLGLILKTPERTSVKVSGNIVFPIIRSIIDEGFSVSSVLHGICMSVCGAVQAFCLGAVMSVDVPGHSSLSGAASVALQVTIFQTPAWS